MKELKKVTKKEWAKIPSDYKGKFMDYHGTHPELKGRKTMMDLDNGMTVLLIEGVHFEIVK